MNFRRRKSTMGESFDKHHRSGFGHGGFALLIVLFILLIIIGASCFGGCGGYGGYGGHCGGYGYC